MRIAIACCRLSADSPADELYPDVDNPLLDAALTDLRIERDFVSWDDETKDWSAFDLVVVRSTWDSVDRPEEYLAWTRRVESCTTLANPAATIEWNLDKRYIGDLASRGIAVPRTTFVAPGESWAPPCDRFVVKPSISAGGRETALYDVGGVDDARAHVDRLHGQGATAMVQEHLPGVEERGEVKQVFIGGGFSHAFRVDPLLAAGAGVIDRPWEVPTHPSVIRPTSAEAALAAAVMEIVGRDLLYARVDVTTDAGGRAVVLEVELIDPALALWADAAAAKRLASTISKRS